ENVGRAGAGHLPFLQWRDPAVGIKDKNGGAGLAEQTMDGGGAGVAGSGAEDGDRFMPRGALPFVKIAEELEGEVLEGKGRAMKQLQHVGALVELHQRSNVGTLELGVRFRHQIVQQVRIAFGRKPPQKLEAELDVAELG